MVQCHINNAIAISPRRRMCPHKKSSHTCTLSLPHMDAGRLIQSIPLISSPSEKPEKAQFVDTSNQRLLHHRQCQMEYIYISVHFLVFIIVIPRKICFPPSDESPGAELNEQESIVILRYFICWLWWKMLKNKERLLFLSHILGIILCTFIKHLKWIWKYLFLKMAWNGLNSKLNIIRPNFHLLKDKHFLNDKVELMNTIQLLKSGSRDHFTG